MYLRSHHLLQFGNCTDQLVAFAAPKTILVGENAQGKSNLLEAVELLATLKSHRASRDRDFVNCSLENTDKAAAHIAAVVDRLGTRHELTIFLRRRGRRSSYVLVNLEAIWQTWLSPILKILKTRLVRVKRGER